MRNQFSIGIAATIILLTAPAMVAPCSAAQIEIELSAVEMDTTVALGVPVTDLQSISVSVSGSNVLPLKECISCRWSDGPEGPYYSCYSVEYPDCSVLRVVVSDRDQRFVFEEFLCEGGTFELVERELYCYSQCDSLLSSGSADIHVYFGDSSYNESYSCVEEWGVDPDHVWSEVVEAGYVELSSPIVLKIDFGDTTPVEERSWDSIKALYR